MNQLPLNKNELPLIREMLTKYKQGYISGLIPGSNITLSPSGCRNKIVSSTGGGGGGGTPAGSDTQIQYNNAGSFGADAGFTRDSLGNTKISATYGGVTYGYKLNSDVFGGLKGTVFNFNDVDEFGITGIVNGGEGNAFISLFQYASGSSSIFSISEKQSQLGISDGDTKDVNLTFDSDVGFNISQTISGVPNGIDTSDGVTKIGNLYGGNNTKITIDDIAQTINFNNNYSFPFADGAAGQVLGTDGSGQLGWQSVSGGGGQIAFTKTKAEIDALIAGNNLVKNALYEITGVHPTLYDDGTTSGTTIYLRAISGNQLEVQGMGKFYNPKYNQSVDGFGIWDDKMYGTLSNVVGNFDYINKESVTADNSATGLILADGMIQWVSGDWSAAVSITGSVSGATADVVDFVTPSYSIGDKVIWGGYSWTNNTGAVGSSVDVLNLDGTNWSKNVYDTTNYNLAYDLIEYDYANDMIIRRHDLVSNIDVRFDKGAADSFTNYYSIAFNAISVQQFGNPPNLVVGKGVFNKLINNGYDESINFCGSYQSNLIFGSYSYQTNLTFGSGSYQYNLTFGSYSYQTNLIFGSYSYQTNLIFGSGSYQTNLTFGNNSNQYNLTFGNNSNQSNLTFGNSSSQENLTFEQSSNQNNLTFGQNSNQSNLIFEQSSNQNNLTFGQNSYQYYLIFGQNSNQSNLIFEQSSNQNNLTFGQSSSQENLTFGQNSYQYYLIFGQNSNQSNLIFEQNSNQNNLTFGQNSQVDFNNQTLNSNMKYVEFKTKDFTVPDLSIATYIFNSNIKEVYQRPDGTIKLKFMNNSDVLEVHGIAD